jgi:prepilin-type N-terminal cleavage/methylation domain-containing protein
MQGMRTIRQHGFTLVELLIVITIIAILALIVIPKVANATHQAKDTQLRTNLQSIRKAIAQFTNDTGYYPYNLAQITVEVQAEPASDDVKGAILSGNDEVQIIGVAKSYRGPYLSKQGGCLDEHGVDTSIPRHPFSAGNDLASSWTYDPATGSVKSAVSGQTTDGVAYSTL